MPRLSNRTALLIISITCLLIALLMSFLFLRPGAKSDGDSFREEFALTLTDYDGNSVQLTDFRRKVLIVYMWASWCPYCADELKNLAALKKEYGEDLSIVAVNRAESKIDAKTYTDELGVGSDLIFLLDPGDTLFKDIGGYAMPETIFINELGNIVHHQRGPIQLPAVREKVNELRR